MIAQLAVVLLAQASTPQSAVNEADAVAKEQAVAAQSEPLLACQKWPAPGLMEGPVFVGYSAADLGIGRRACPRTEVGIGLDFGAIIDTPNFYGDVGVQGVLYGSVALGDKTELFGMLEAVDFQYTVNAVISGTRLTLGNATLGVARQVYQTDEYVGALSARLLLPTASNIPGTRNIGAELGHSTSMRMKSWLELHAYAGLGFTAGIGPAPLPQFSVTGMLGLALSPFSWFSFVLDVSGGVASRSFFAPSAALRFRVGSLGIELGVTRPIAGDDRHTAIGALRIAWRI